MSSLLSTLLPGSGFLTGPEAFSSPSSMNSQGHRLSTELSPALLLSVTWLLLTAPMRPGLLGLVPPVGREAVGASSRPVLSAQMTPASSSSHVPLSTPSILIVTTGCVPSHWESFCRLCEIFCVKLWEPLPQSDMSEHLCACLSPH